MLLFTFGSSALTVCACGVASPVELLLVGFSEKAEVCALRLIVDIAEDCTYVLSHVLVEVTGLSSCV